MKRIIHLSEVPGCVEPPEGPGDVCPLIRVLPADERPLVVAGIRALPVKSRAIRAASCLVAASLILWLAGCVTAVPGADPNLLAFLREAETTREKVLLTLGQPSGSFEHERILTYRIGEDSEHGRYVVSARSLMPWQNVRYSLVLVFDEAGTLNKQQLVPVH